MATITYEPNKLFPLAMENNPWTSHPNAVYYQLVGPETFVSLVQTTGLPAVVTDVDLGAGLHRLTFEADKNSTIFPNGVTTMTYDLTTSVGVFTIDFDVRSAKNGYNVVGLEIEGLVTNEVFSSQQGRQQSTLSGNCVVDIANDGGTIKLQNIGADSLDIQSIGGATSASMSIVRVDD